MPLNTQDLSPFGHPKGQDVDGTWTRNAPIDFEGGGVVANAAAIKAIAAVDRFEGMVVRDDATRSFWIFDADSTLADTTENLVLTPDAGTGRWIRMDKSVHLKLAIGFATADAAQLFQVPAGFRLEVRKAYWEITSDFTGGTNSAIGVSSDVAPHSTKGDILGGAGGDVAADLQAADGVTQGTIGVSFSAAPKLVVLEAASKVRFDRIVDAFTAGAGFVHLDCQVVS